MEHFSINYIDHVAIRVMDMEKSAKWYIKIFGFKKVLKKEWGDFPICLLAGKMGLALFPASKPNTADPKESNFTRIDHFAFNVSKDNFSKAEKRLQHLKIPFVYQNHQYFESIYLSDPDGHTVELTTLIVAEHEFFDKL